MLLWFYMRKWDFHVHTPYSILNNNYGFNPFELTESDLETEFDEYVKNRKINNENCLYPSDDKAIDSIWEKFYEERK